MKRTSRILGRASVILIGLWLVSVTPAGQGGSTRRGPVRADRYAVVDDGGAFNALGATFFWAAWGYKFDRPRLERNLETLSHAGFDYIRVLGSVGGRSWEDRQTDPRWDDYDAVIAGLTDLAYDRYGLRVQWTILGGAPFTPPGPAREHLVDRFALVAKGREHKIFAFEIANEGWGSHLGFGTAKGLAELRRLGQRLSDRTTVLVVLTAPTGNIADSACQTYAGAGADAATMHYERSSGKSGPLDALRGPWTYPGAFDADCRGQLPTLVFNNEPIGPESSVRQDDDPGRIAAAFVLTFLAKNAAYVLHAGPGIRGGGAADVDGPLRRHANFDELPAFSQIVGALRAARMYLPAGLANGTRYEPDDPAAPIQGLSEAARAGAIASAYSASVDSGFVVLVLDVRQPVTLRPRVASAVDVRAAATGSVIRQMKLAAREPFTLERGPAMILSGRLSSAELK